MSNINDQTILDPEVLTGIIKQFMDKEKTPITDLFRQNIIPCDMGVAEWDEVRGSRTLTKHAGQDVPARKVGLLGVRKQKAELARIAVKKFIPNSKISYAREPGTLNRERLERKVNDELTDLSNQIWRTVEKISTDALFGSIDISQAGDDNQEIIISVSFGLTVLSAAASWATAGTKIISADGEIANIRLAMQSAFGDSPALFIGKDKLARVLMANTEVVSLFSDQRKDAVFANHQLEILDGLRFRYYDHGYLDDAGAFTKVIPDNFAMVLPPDQRDIMGMCEGPELVPSSIGVVNLNSLQYVDGLWSYAKVTDDPVGVWIHAGINYLPVWLKTNAPIKFKYII